MGNDNNEYSINKICDTNYKLVVPIYQRLFAWGDDQISTILNDIYKKYTESNGNDKYYIGMITIIENTTNWDLVDGQQRITFLYLLLIYLHLKIKDIKDIEELEDTIKKFCCIDNNIRLVFSCREKDNVYIKRLFSSNNVEDIFNVEAEYYNEKMNNALKTINKYFNKIDEEKKDENFIINFSKYICNNVVFFVSNLPEEYSESPKLLNKYFERMNESGKNLENVEILKVDIIAKLVKNDEKEYLDIWNKISDFDKMFFSKDENEETEKYRKKYLDSIYSTIKIIHGAENDKNNQNESFDDSDKDLDSIERKKYEFNKNNKIDDRTYRALLKFDEFLLITLYCFYKETNMVSENNCIAGINTNDFFNTNNLLETFKKTLFDDNFNKGIGNNDERYKEFLDLLLKYKLIFDYYIIKISTKNDSYDYELELLKNEQNNNEINEYKKKYIKYMSMMYVSSNVYTYYKWLPDLLIFISEYQENKETNSTIDMQICAENLYKKILEIDDKWHKIDNLELKDLSYEKIDRYWLWKIDYLLWENRGKWFDEENKKVADNYVFKRNRSIEHIEPQHPKVESDIKWDEITNGNVKLNSLGNLAMISSGLNSSLSNSSINVKMAYVKDYINKNKNGSIESLKLLWTYKEYDKLEKDHREEKYVEKIEEYEKFFIELLKNNKTSEND